MVWKKILLRYDPFGTHKHGDDGGPYFNCRQCCYFGYPKKSKEVDPGSVKEVLRQKRSSSWNKMARGSNFHKRSKRNKYLPPNSTRNSAERGAQSR